jgi:hypothetical protein
MRYARPSCKECLRLAAECNSRYQDYLDAKDALKLTRKNDRLYGERAKHLKTAIGRLREAHRRDSAHEATHQDEFS